MWEYKARRKTTSGTKNRTKWRFIFFKNNNKVTADVIFPAYRNIEDLWGTCSLNTVAVSKNVTSNSQKTFNSINDNIICNRVNEGKSDFLIEAKRRGLKMNMKK